MVRITRRVALAASAALLAAPGRGRAAGASIRIGEINSYSAIPAFTLPYRSGWQLATEEVNAAGGVLGRPLAVLSRDDAGKPADAIRFAGELLNGEGVDLLAGGYLSNIGLALSEFAARAGKLYLAGEPLADALVWQNGNPTCFRLRPSTYVQTAMLVPEAVKLGAKRWATIAPNYEYGQSAVKWFKQLLAQAQPGVEFVAEQWPALGKIDAGSVVGAIGAAKPDAIFNVTFGPDVTNLVRQGSTRGLFPATPVVSLLTGEPEYLAALGADTPDGWIVTGYPVEADAREPNQAFIRAYRAKFGEPPRMGSVVGYALIKSIAAGIEAAGALDTPALIHGFSGARFPTPFGEATYRAIDHQSTMGAYVGRLAQRGGAGVMVDWRYVDGASVMPADSVVETLRPAK